MNKILLLIIATVGLALGLSSCEQTVDAQLPYTEQLVIRAILIADSDTPDITITRTLPPLTEYSDNAALVKDAVAYITGPGEKRYKLTYQESNQKYKVDNLIPKAGESYRLEVTSGGKSAYAQTVIPEPITIEGFELTNELEYENHGYRSWIIIVSAIFKPINNYVYISGEMNSYSGKYYMWNIIKQNTDAMKDGKIRIPVIVQQTNDTNSYSMKDFIGREVFVESYDNQFYAYYNSRSEGNSGNDIFGTSGSNIRWNVKGDGIGIFFGLNLATKTIE